MSLDILEIIINSTERTKLIVFACPRFFVCCSSCAESDDDMGFGLFD